MIKEIVLSDGEKITFELNGKNGVITSEGLKCKNIEDSQEYNAAIDALESLILGHACAGIDVTSEEYVEGIQTALEAISNNF